MYFNAFTREFLDTFKNSISKNFQEFFETLQKEYFVRIVCFCCLLHWTFS